MALSQDLFSATGVPGLKGSRSGFIYEEFLPQLRAQPGARQYREMADNDPVIGGMLWAVEAMCRKVEWRLEAPDQSKKTLDDVAFADEVLFQDMARPFSAVIEDALTMLTHGYAPMETVWKRRNGWRPGTILTPSNSSARPPAPVASSRFADGRIGIDRLFLINQDTVWRWYFDDAGQWFGLEQITEDRASIQIPRQKLLDFRTTGRLDNPEGRALDPETPIPTPDGWRLLDALRVGDKVFDEQGKIRYVTARADWENRPCYRVRFTDGTEIVADANHEWLARETANDRGHGFYHGRVRSTETLARIIRVSRSTAASKISRSNYAITRTQPLDYSRQILPLDPWYLGLWLGDGSKSSSSISAHLDDVPETVEMLQTIGFSTNVSVNGDPKSLGRHITVGGSSKWGSDNPQRILRTLGLIGNKHIPEVYLRGSEQQRRDLLAGLMDSDGSVDKFGRCEFGNINRNLIDGVAELVRSLGVGAWVRGGRIPRPNKNKLHGTIRGKHPSWRVVFTPPFAPFRLSRKVARCGSGSSRPDHYFAAIEPVERRRTVCIETDAPSHLFLAGRGMVPTHNSILRNAYVPYTRKKIIEIAMGRLALNAAGIVDVAIPGKYLDIEADDGMKAIRAMFEAAGQALAQNKVGHFLRPSDGYGPAGENEMFSIKFISTDNRNSADQVAIIDMYDRRIAMSVLADFLLIGQAASGGGSRALVDSRTSFFGSSVIGILRSIKDELNRTLLPRLWRINGLPDATMPQLEHEDLEVRDLAEMAQYLTALSNAGAPLFPDIALENKLRADAGLPPVDQDQRLLDQTMLASLTPAAPAPGGPAPPAPVGVSTPAPPASEPPAPPTPPAPASGTPQA